MYVFLLLLSLLVALSIARPGKIELHDFDAKATAPLRGLLALFIIFHHFSQRAFLSTSFNWTFSSMGLPVVDIFFLISGYGLARSLQKKGIGYLDGFLPKRLGKILPEFLLLTVFAAAVYIAKGSQTWPEMCGNMARGETPLPFSWFIVAITFVYIAFYVASGIARGEVIRTGLVYAVSVAVYIVVVSLVLRWGVWWYLSIASTVAGYFIAICEDKATRILGSRKCLVSFLLLCLALVWADGVVASNTEIASFVLTLLTYACIRLYGSPGWKPLVWLGGISLNIYLVHGIILLALLKRLPPLAALCGTVLLSVAAAFAMQLLRRRFVHYAGAGKTR